MTSHVKAPRPRGLFLAGVVLVVEALLMVGFGVVEAASIHPSRWVVGVGAAVLALAYGAFLGAVGRGVLLGRRWSRGPAVATQLIHLPVAWSFAGEPTTAFAWVLIAASVIAVACLLLPASTAVFVEGDPNAEAGPDNPTDAASTR